MSGIRSAEDIGAKIKGRRKELGLSQEKLAEALDVSYQQVQRYESGVNMLSAEKLQAVATSLDVPVGYFFDEAGSAVSDATAPYLSSEESRVLRLFRKIGDEHKESVFQFLELAARKG